MKKAVVNKSLCVACGCCTKVCRKNAVDVVRGVYAAVQTDRCVGCGLCAKECPAGVIRMEAASNE